MREEPGPESVLVLVSKRTAIAPLRLGRLLRGVIERQLVDRGYSFAGAHFYGPTQGPSSLKVSTCRVSA
jgi:hypothetical protein